MFPEPTQDEAADILAEIEAAEPIEDWTPEAVQMAVQLASGIVESEVSI